MSDEQKPRDPGLGGPVGSQASAGPINGARLQSAKHVNGAMSAGPSANPNHNGKMNGHSMNGHMNGRMDPAGALQPNNKERLTGVCKNWAKGYGFISRNDGQGDVFVHQTQIRKNGFRSLQIGEQVEFDIETKEDGRKQAVNVTGPNGVDVIGQERHTQNRGGGYSRGGGYNQGGDAFGGRKSNDTTRPLQAATAAISPVSSNFPIIPMGFQAAPYGTQPNFGQGYTPFIQQPYAYGQATSGFGQAAPYPQPGQPPAQYAAAQPVAPYGAPAQFAQGSAPSPYGAMAAYAQASSAPQGGDPAKATSPRTQGSYGQQSGYGQPAYTQAATE